MTQQTAFRCMVAALIISIVGLLSIPQAKAQSACGPLQVLLDGFRKKYGEVIIWEGRNPTHRTIITANGEGRWSAFQVAIAGGPACLVAAGDTNRTDKGI